MLKNFYKVNRELEIYALGPLFYIGGLFCIILFFRHLTGIQGANFLLERFWLGYLLLSLSGLLFKLKMNSFIFVWWRFFYGLFFVSLYISVLVQMAYFSGWHVASVVMVCILVFYVALFLLRFVFWSDFYCNLKLHGKLGCGGGCDIFYLKRDGYVEVYELNGKLHALKYAAFWEKDFFSKSIPLNPEALSPYNKMTWSIIALGALFAVYTGFNMISAVIIIGLSLLIPEFLRHFVASAFLDAVLASKYKVGDTIDFSSKRQSESD